jgi:hypothetical protein
VVVDSVAESRRQAAVPEGGRRCPNQPISARVPRLGTNGRSHGNQIDEKELQSWSRRTKALTAGAGKGREQPGTGGGTAALWERVWVAVASR